MLDPPITQADVDAGTVFVRRDGGEVIIEASNISFRRPEWTWRDGKACEITTT